MTDKALKLTDTSQVPDTPEARIAQIMALPLKDKQQFMPPAGLKLQAGPYIYKIGFVNAGQLRFTAKLCDVIIEGVNDGKPEKSLIIKP